MFASAIRPRHRSIAVAACFVGALTITACKTEGAQPASTPQGSGETAPGSAPADEGAGASTAATGARRSDGLLAEGEQAPELAKNDHRGQAVDLRNLAGKPALIYFYPKDATPGCTKEACAFRDVWSKFETDGVLVLGVSADDNESHAAFAKEHSLPFGLIADEDGSWAKAFGVKVSGMGMPARVSFLIGRDGRVAKVYPGVDPGVHASEVLADVAALPK